MLWINFQNRDSMRNEDFPMFLQTLQLPTSWRIWGNQLTTIELTKCWNWREIQVEVPLSIQTYHRTGCIARLVKRKSITLTRIMITTMNFPSWPRIMPLSYSGLLLRRQYILLKVVRIWLGGCFRVWSRMAWSCSSQALRPRGKPLLQIMPYLSTNNWEQQRKASMSLATYILSRGAVTGRLNSSRR
jgi:hypothetical protein